MDNLAHPKARDSALVYGQIACGLGALSGIMSAVALGIAFGLAPSSAYGAAFWWLIVAIIAIPIQLGINGAGIAFGFCGLLTRSDVPFPASVSSQAALVLHVLPTLVMLGIFFGDPDSLIVGGAGVLVLASFAAIAVGFWSHSCAKVK